MQVLHGAGIVGPLGAIARCSSIPTSAAEESLAVSCSVGGRAVWACGDRARLGLNDRALRVDRSSASVPVRRRGLGPDLAVRFAVRIGSLTGDDSRVRVQVIHLPPGGLIGRHVATVPQLFAVVAGTGWVSGEDAERRDIGPGYAALWAAGEDHEAHSDDGLTAVCVEGEFEIGDGRDDRHRGQRL